MDEAQELLLQMAVADGLPVYWVSPYDGTVHRVSSVRARADEPSLVAYLDHAGPNAYAALYNCDLAEFYLMQPLCAPPVGRRPVEMIDRAP